MAHPGDSCRFPSSTVLRVVRHWAYYMLPLPSKRLELIGQWRYLVLLYVVLLLRHWTCRMHPVSCSYPFRRLHLLSQTLRMEANTLFVKCRIFFAEILSANSLWMRNTFNIVPNTIQKCTFFWKIRGVSVDLYMLFDFFIWISEHPPRADKSAMGTINRTLQPNELICSWVCICLRFL